ncbi:unnamed protein product [Polarella glacialis]|uniref:Uncharacterized protein n=1 Tax=Polarella glacialis TaxID=89957 RepID=A0A813JD21_POLGL|nr:unnamed protein product [Polarella glacialis]
MACAAPPSAWAAAAAVAAAVANSLVGRRRAERSSLGCQTYAGGSGQEAAEAFSARAASSIHQLHHKPETKTCENHVRHQTQHPAHERQQHFPHRHQQQQQHNASLAVTAASSQRTAVLVRTHRPTSAALDRFRAWAEDLEGLPGVDFWISADTTWAHLGARECLQNAVAQWPPALSASVKLHFYDSSQLLDAYPVLLELLPTVVGSTMPGGGHYQAGLCKTKLYWYWCVCFLFQQNHHCAPLPVRTSDYDCSA